jgi:hypothetical protein
VFLLLIIFNLLFLVIQKKRSTIVLSYFFPLAIFTAISLYFFNYTVDDSYISLRYARNLHNGYGMVFNTDGSTPIEGYTNFLWIILEYLFLHLNLSESTLTYAIKLTGYFFGVGFVVFSAIVTKQISGKTIYSQISCLLFSLIPYFSLWSIAGLETSLFLFLFLLSLSTVLFENKNSKSNILSSFFLLLLSLTRPEGILISCAFFICNILCIKNKKYFLKIIPGFLLFVCLFLSYFLWRYNYFGYLLPNSFYAKRNINGIFGIVKRFIELFPFYQFYLPIFFLNILYFVTKKSQLFLKVLVIIMQATPFIASREWMPGFRYELPMLSLTLPFAIIIFGNILHTIKDSSIALILKNKSLQIILFSIFILICGFYSISAIYTLKQETNNYMVIMNNSLSPIAKWLQKYSPQNSSYADHNMGLIPYISRIDTIIDIHEEGLLNTRTTHIGYDEKYLLSLKPTFFTLLAGSSIANSKEFEINYIHVIRTKYDNRYLDVYVRKDVQLPANAFIEGEEITKKSLN